MRWIFLYRFPFFQNVKHVLCCFNKLFQEKDETMKLNPDLYYNCATVSSQIFNWVAESAKNSTNTFHFHNIFGSFQAYKYLENYESALRGFEAAALKDPALRADIEVQKIINLLDKLENATKVPSVTIVSALANCSTGHELTELSHWSHLSFSLDRVMLLNGYACM